ncbi:hypothetical protein CF386_03720 [Paraphotobacterium marinum]|uniref:Type II secretion system protein M n=1 Tax=Paraphotobacterium marinum TaxID=1755811 RepID=A0A220VE65_9GAMM|nr:type II secretion system protein GspM [Paraphotobacterium marinum]ASK78203.1 hypothetical protein CF386_03720 [Paraphotobacterium marinum]
MIKKWFLSKTTREKFLVILLGFVFCILVLYFLNNYLTQENIKQSKLYQQSKNNLSLIEKMSKLLNKDNRPEQINETLIRKIAREKNVYIKKVKIANKAIEVDANAKNINNVIHFLNSIEIEYNLTMKSISIEKKGDNIFVRNISSMKK